MIKWCKQWLGLGDYALLIVIITSIVVWWCCFD